MDSSRFKLLVNFPPTYFTVPWLQLEMLRLHSLADVRTSSHNTREEIADDLAWADGVIMWSWPDIDEALLEKTGKLTYVGQINTSPVTAQALLEMQVPLSEARHCWSPAVAEMALTLILSGLRRVSDFHAAMRSSNEMWINDFPADVDTRERELTGLTVGIVGFGAIGQRLAKLLQPFAIKLLAYDPFLPEEIIANQGGVKACLDTLAKSADIVVLCAANISENKHLFDKQLVNELKNDAMLVNVGRSMLVDIEALIIRLKKGELTAMLDVFDREPLEENSILRELPNVYCTPHRAGGLANSVKRGLTMLTDDLERTLKGEERSYAVTKQMMKCFG